MSTLSSLVPVGGRLSRVMIRSSWPSTFVASEMCGTVCLSQSSPNRTIKTAACNQTPTNHLKKQQIQQYRKILPTGAKTAQQRRQLSTQADDDVHRYRYQLFKYKICPFSNIAKTFLEYQRIPFDSIEVNPLTKAELGFSKDYRKVPIVTILDTDATTPAAKAHRQLNGTEEILPHNYDLVMSEGDEFSSGETSLQWQDFARNKLAILLYPNICKSVGDSFRAFDYVHLGANTFSLLQRYSIQYVGSVAMYFAASKIKEKYNIDDVQVALDQVLDELEQELSETDFLGSCTLHLGDLAVFGVLKGLEGLPLWHEIFDTNGRYPSLRQWYATVEREVETRKMETPQYGYNH